MIKVGILGTGFGTSIIGPSLINHSDFKVHSVFSRDRKKAKNAKKELGADYYYDNWKELIDNGCNLVCVALPPFMHYEVAKYALENGKHVVLTAPYCLDVEKGEELVEIAENHQLQTAVLHYLNYLPARNYAVNLLKNGKIGRILSLDRTLKNSNRYNTNYEHTWHYSKKLGGGLLNREGAHDVDYLLRVLGGVKKVSSSSETIFQNRKISGDELISCTADDWFRLDLEFHKGPRAYIEVNCAYPGRPVNEFIFYGTNGTLVLKDDKELSYFDNNGKRNRLAIPPRYQMVNLPGPKDASPVYMFMETLAECIESNGSISPTFSEAIHTQRVLQTAEAAQETGRWIKVGSGTEKEQQAQQSGQQIDKIYE